MHPDSHKIEILGIVSGSPGAGNYDSGDGSILQLFTHGESIQVEISDRNGRKGIHVPPSELLTGVRIMADDIPEATTRAVAAVVQERARQRELWMAEKLPFNCDAEDIGLGEKLSALAEEFGEVAKEVNEANASIHPREPMQRLRIELIQVAAVAVAWAESLENV